MIDLISKIRRGEYQYLDELVEYLYPEIFRYCLRHCATRTLSEDATQETFLRGMRYFEQCGATDFRSLLYKIARNICIDYARRPSLVFLDTLEAESPFQESGYQTMESQQDFLLLVKHLPEEQREIVYLRFAHDLKLKEIADIQCLPLRTVQSRLRAALKALKIILEKSEGCR